MSKNQKPWPSIESTVSIGQNTSKLSRNSLTQCKTHFCWVFKNEDGYQLRRCNLCFSAWCAIKTVMASSLILKMNSGFWARFKAYTAQEALPLNLIIPRTRKSCCNNVCMREKPAGKCSQTSQVYYLSCRKVEIIFWFILTTFRDGQQIWYASFNFKYYLRGKIYCWCNLAQLKVQCIFQ